MRRSAAPSQRSNSSLLAAVSAPVSRSNADILALLAGRTASATAQSSVDKIRCTVSEECQQTDNTGRAIDNTNHVVGGTKHVIDRTNQMTVELEQSAAAVSMVALERPAQDEPSVWQRSPAICAPCPPTRDAPLRPAHRFSLGQRQQQGSTRPALQPASVNTLPADGGAPEEVRYFACVWGKKSNRKHKKWEGDAFLKATQQSVLLLDEGGQILGRGSGCKAAQLTSLAEGDQLSVGQREVEISGIIAAAEWEQRRAQGACAPAQQSSAIPRKAASKRKKPDEEEEEEGDEAARSLVLERIRDANRTKFRPFKMPGRVGGDHNAIVPPRTVAPGVPMYDPRRCDALVLPRPPADHPLHTHQLVDVVLDPYVGRHLRTHQRAGVLFLYRCVMGYSRLVTHSGEHPIRGAILADDMGLGKTLQTVALIWTLMKQSPVAGSVTAKKILVVAPASLLNNWAAEFRKWLGSERVVIHVADSVAKVATFRSYNSAPILVTSYELLLRAEAEVGQVRWDLLVCDEAHRLKNSEIKTSCCLTALPCERRVLLTGTPVQNDLGEYYCLVNVVAPGLLGTRAEFNARFAGPIEAGRQPGAEPEVREAAETALQQLAQISDALVLRRTSETMGKLLPPKTTNVVMCRPSEWQSQLYASQAEQALAAAEPGSHLAAIARLKKICNSPLLLTNHQIPGGVGSWEEQSGKLAVLACMLISMAQEGDEKIVLVSLSTSTLDLLASLCERYNLPTTRLDGTTPPQARQTLVNAFNSPTSPTRVFLLSSKAGGTGLNLIGASRIVLYDIDWNPATDLQAMARIWRDGQKKPCHIYRLLTTGTIEEKIYQRQVMKSGLAGGLESAGLTAGAVHFTQEELRDLFTFNPATSSDTHDLLDCECGGSGDITTSMEEQEQVEARPCQLGSRAGSSCSRARSTANMEQLRAWLHFRPPLQDKIEDDFLVSAEPYITFLFRHFEETPL